MFATAEELAAAEKINASYISRVLRLTLLAPDIVEAILDGRQPADMTLAGLMRPVAVGWPANAFTPCYDELRRVAGSLAPTNSAERLLLAPRRKAYQTPRLDPRSDESEAAVSRDRGDEMAVVVGNLSDTELRNLIENHRKKGAQARPLYTDALRELEKRKGKGLDFDKSVEIIRRAGSCPTTWCRSDAPGQRWLHGQAASGAAVCGGVGGAT